MRGRDDLSRSEAVRLFVERALAVVPGFALDEQNAEAIAQICRRLDGIPLALELAAARLTTLSPNELANRLHDRFRLLTGGLRTALPRQRTLRALVDWSYDLLSEIERSVLMALSVFSSGFTLAAAEAVCGEITSRDASVLDSIERLVAKSLVLAEHDFRSPTRFHLLETIRQYAAEKLVDAQRADSVRRRHFDYFLALAERAEPELRRANVLEWLDALESEHDNLRIALDWAADADAKRHARLAGALHDFWNMRGYFVEGFERLERAVALHAVDDAARLAALLGAGALAYRLDTRHRSAELLDAAAALARRLGDARREAEATLWRACALDSQGFGFIESMAEKGLALSRSVDDAWGVGFAMWHFALAKQLRGLAADAQRLFLESAAHFDHGGCVLMAALARTSAGECAIECLDFGGARALLDAALAEHRRLGNTHDAATTLRYLAKLDLNVRQLKEALRASDEAVAVFRKLQDPNCCARATLVHAEILHAAGEHRLALGLADQATDVQAHLGFQNNRALALLVVGRCHEALGDREAARNACFEGLRAAMQTSTVSTLAMLGEAIAGLHPQSDAAPRLLGYAGATREALNLPVLPSARDDLERWTAAVETAHGDAFTSSVAKGRSMTREQAIAAALALDF
jgi:predicted ATPase